MKASCVRPDLVAWLGSGSRHARDGRRDCGLVPANTSRRTCSRAFGAFVPNKPTDVAALQTYRIPESVARSVCMPLRRAPRYSRTCNRNGSKWAMPRHHRPKGCG